MDILDWLVTQPWNMLPQSEESRIKATRLSIQAWHHFSILSESKTKKSSISSSFGVGQVPGNGGSSASGRERPLPFPSVDRREVPAGAGEGSLTVEVLHSCIRGTGADNDDADVGSGGEGQAKSSTANSRASSLASWGFGWTSRRVRSLELEADLELILCGLGRLLGSHRCRGILGRSLSGHRT